METIRKRIKEEILNSKYKQSEIAKKIGIRQQTANDYVREKSLPALDTLAKLCILLDLDANYILGITNYTGKKLTLEPKNNCQIDITITVNRQKKVFI